MGQEQKLCYQDNIHKESLACSSMGRCEVQGHNYEVTASRFPQRARTALKNKAPKSQAGFLRLSSSVGWSKQGVGTRLLKAKRRGNVTCTSPQIIAVKSSAKTKFPLATQYSCQAHLDTWHYINTSHICVHKDFLLYKPSHPISTKPRYCPFRYPSNDRNLRKALPRMANSSEPFVGPGGC